MSESSLLTDTLTTMNITQGMIKIIRDELIKYRNNFVLNNESTASRLYREPIQKDLQVKIHQARAIEIFQPDLPIIVTCQVIHNFPQIIDFFELISSHRLNKE